MFEDSLLESCGRLKPKHGLATLASILVHCCLIAALVLFPLAFPATLPEPQLITFLVVAPPPPPPPPPPPLGSGTAGRIVNRLITHDVEIPGVIHAPALIPRLLPASSGQELSRRLSGDETVAGGVPGGVPGGVIGGVPGGVVGGVLGGVVGGTLGGVIGGIVSSVPDTTTVPKVQPPPSLKPKQVRVSEGVSKGLLIREVIPKYPELAREARISGNVVLFAIIDKNGEIKNLRVVSGHPLLAAAALEAVQHWQYKPYLLNHEPVEVETQVTVSFNLAGAGG